MKTILGWVGLGAMTCAMGCSEPSGSASDQVPLENGGAAPGGPGGTADGGAAAAGTFHVNGSIPLASLSTKTLDVGDAGPKHVTHVMGVTPSSQNTRRVVSKVSPNGTFQLDLDPARLWVVVFLDASRVGADMVMGVFRAQGLDTMAPMAAGTLDLGALAFLDGRATGATSYANVLSALTLDVASAEYLASVDDVCLRVVNPDVDGNGVIDALEEGKSFLLDFHVQFSMRGEANITVADLVRDFPPDTVTMAYGGTGIYASFRGFKEGWQSTMSASFDEELHYMPMSTSGPPGPARVLAAGASMATADLLATGFGDYGSVGTMAIPGFDMPQGTYRFGVGPSVLTFTGVRTWSDSRLAAAESFIMPFVHLVKADPTCESDCALEGFEYAWRKRTDAGWVPATPGELAAVAGEQGGFLSIRLDNDPNRNIGFQFPAKVSGTVPWNTAMSPDPTLAATATTSTLCHIGLSYDDKLGMRYFGSIENTPGTCGR